MGFDWNRCWLCISDGFHLNYYFFFIEGEKNKTENERRAENRQSSSGWLNRVKTDGLRNELDLSRNPRRLQQRGVQRLPRASATQPSPWHGWMECLREQSSSPCFVFPPYTLPLQRRRCPTANRWRTEPFALAQGCPLWAVIISLLLSTSRCPRPSPPPAPPSAIYVTRCTQFIRLIWPWWPSLRLLKTTRNNTLCTGV